MTITEGAGGIVEVALGGRLDTPGVAQIELRFTASLVPRAARAIVDLSQVEFIGSMGIRMFITVARALAKKQGKLILYAPQPLVKEVLDTVSLGEIIPVKTDSSSGAGRCKLNSGKQERRIDANPTRLRFPGTLPGFERGFVALRTVLDGCALSADLRFRVELVFEEVVANIVRHGARPSGETHIEVMLEAGPGVVTLTFDDDGVAFDPCSGAAAGGASAAHPANLEEAPDGGFGLTIVRRAASEMRYSRTTDARNHLTVELRASSSPVPTLMSASTLPIFRIVGFSGHRHLADLAGPARAIRVAVTELRREAPGDWIGLSSVAAGSDQLFVQQVLDQGLSWHAILPLPRTQFQQDFTPEDWAVAQGFLARADHVRVIGESASCEDGYLDCGMDTVNDADVLIALWDGQPARGKGGTAEVVEYASALGKPILIIDAKTFAVRKLNWQELQTQEDSLAELNRLPDVAGEANGATDDESGGPRNIHRFMQKCDAAATRAAPQFRRLIASTVMLHVLATFMAAAVLAYELRSAVWPWIKLLCLIGALGVAIVLRRRGHSNSSWVRCRLAAEFCRSAIATWGLPRAAPLFQDLNLPVVHGLTRSLHILHSRSAVSEPMSIDKFKQKYISQRIDDQIAYYQRQEGRALPQFSRLKAAFWTSTLLAIACTLIYALADTWDLEPAEWVVSTIFHFLPTTLPVAAAAFISLISINDLQRRVARYREMKFMLMDSRHQVKFCETWNSLERVVLKTERALLQEVLEWHSITSFSESH